MYPIHPRLYQQQPVHNEPVTPITWQPITQDNPLHDIIAQLGLTPNKWAIGTQHNDTHMRYQNMDAYTDITSHHWYNRFMHMQQVTPELQREIIRAVRYFHQHQEAIQEGAFVFPTVHALEAHGYTYKEPEHKGNEVLNDLLMAIMELRYTETEQRQHVERYLNHEHTHVNSLYYIIHDKAPMEALHCINSILHKQKRQKALTHHAYNALAMYLRKQPHQAILDALQTHRHNHLPQHGAFCKETDCSPDEPITVYRAYYKHAPLSTNNNPYVWYTSPIDAAHQACAVSDMRQPHEYGYDVTTITVNDEAVLHTMTDTYQPTSIILDERVHKKPITHVTFPTYRELMAQLSDHDTALIQHYEHQLRTEQEQLNLYAHVVHDIHHVQRVLTLAIAICATDAHYTYTDADKRIIAFAAMYHDCGRTHEGVDDCHGFFGTQRVHALQLPTKHQWSETETRIIDTLISYHNVEDEVAMNAISEQWVDETERAYVTRLYNVLCDADALDRHRLFDVNLHYTRLPHTHTLVHAAYEFVVKQS